MLKAFFLAVFALVLTAAMPQAMAQVDPFVIVPENPDGGGHFGANNAAVTSTTLNVRAGPGTQFQVIAVLHHGQQVRIVTCEGSWCWISQSGPDGWVNQTHLVRIGGGAGDNAGAPPHRPVQLRGACFYEQERFRGRAFCAAAGDSDRDLGWWNNRVRSIRISGLVTVQVCTDRSFLNCNAFNRNQSSLPRWLRGNVSAFRIFQ